MSPQEMREQTPGVHLEEKGQGEEGRQLLGDNKKPQPKTKTTKKEPLQAGQNFRVVGQIGGIQNGVLTVLASQPIQIEIDPNAVVTVPPMT